MYSKDHPYYRHPDGTFQLDLYRAEALALRRAEMQNTSKLTSFLKLLAIVAVLLGMVVAAPKNDGTGDNVAASRPSSQAAASHAAPARPPVF